MSLIYGYSADSGGEDSNVDTTQIEKNKLDIEKLQTVKFKETTGSFVAPLDDAWESRNYRVEYVRQQHRNCSSLKS